MKRKTNLAIISIAFICLFAISLATTVNAAADLKYDGVSYASKIEIQNLPIVVSVKFIWATGPSVQKLDYVWLDYDTQKEVVEGQDRVTYDCYWEGFDFRPTIVLMEIPFAGMTAGMTIYFKISYQWDKSGEKDMIERPAATHSVRILEKGQINKENLILYCSLGGAGAVLLIVLGLVYRRKRR